MRPTIALLTWLALCGAARAEDEGGRAGELARGGERACAEGRFAEAADLFEKAFTISGRPRLLWHIASAWEKQYQVDGEPERLRTARALYHNYATSEGTAEAERAAAERRIAEIDGMLANPPARGEAKAAADLSVAAAAPSREGPRRRWWLWAGGAVLAAAAVVGIVVTVLLTRPQDPGAPSTAGGTLVLRFP